MNVVLIGMPGCGKSVIGKELAERLDCGFYDCDSFIEEEYGMSIPEIFEKHGESEFRRMETNACRRLAQKDGVVISTGGGCVERKENIDVLEKNGVIIFIDRCIKDIIGDIDISARPLLADKKERLMELYERRNPLYHEFCSVRVENNKDINDTVEKILNEVERL